MGLPQKEHFKERERDMKPLKYVSYTIIKQIGENAFKLDLPPYTSIHLVFNTNYLKLYKPSMMDDDEKEFITLAPEV